MEPQENQPIEFKAVLPELPEEDLGDDLQRLIVETMECLKDTSAKEKFRDRLQEICTRAMYGAGKRKGVECTVVAADFYTWDKANTGLEMPKVGTIYDSLRLANDALGMGYNALSVLRQRKRGSSTITARGITIEIL